MKIERSPENFRTVRENLTVAHAMADFEAYFSSVPVSVDLDKREVDARLAKVPERFRSGFESALQRFRAIRTHAQTCRMIMDAALDEGMSREELAQQVFFEITGSKPVGRVYAGIQEPYLVVFGEDAVDYAKLWVAGDPDNEEVVRAERSAACYARARRLAMFGGSPIGVVAVQGAPDKDPEEVAGFLGHEKQHFINQAVLGLVTAEVPSGEPQDMRFVKDELLAKIRNGTTPEYFTKMPQSKIYKKLFDELRPDAYASAIKALEELAAFMGRRGYFSADPTKRSLLAYRLMPIDLADWPEWIRLMDRFDAEDLRRASVKESGEWMSGSVG